MMTTTILENQSGRGIRATRSHSDQPAGGRLRYGTMVSVITVVRNSRSGLARTIESVRSQTYPFLEYIVIDGASDDGTVELIQSADDIVDDWQSQADDGIYDAMNKGLGRAKGEMVLFLNAGDTFVNPKSLETAVRAAGRCSDADIFYFGATGDEGQRATRFDRVSAIRFDSVGSHQAVMVRRTVHQYFPFDARYRIKADRDVQLRMYLAGWRMQSIPTKLSSIQGGGISARAIPRKEWENVAICLRHRVGLGWTAIAILLAIARVSFYGLARVTRLDWETTKAFFDPQPRVHKSNG